LSWLVAAAAVVTVVAAELVDILQQQDILYLLAL
jgi:hypothetical protein